MPQRPNNLLALLAPAAAANEAHHLTAISLRQRWRKGTRFLSAEALAALVDKAETETGFLCIAKPAINTSLPFIRFRQPLSRA